MSQIIEPKMMIFISLIATNNYSFCVHVTRRPSRFLADEYKNFWSWRHFFKKSWFSYLWTCQLIKVMQDLICICEQETFTRFINKFRLNRQSFTCKNCQTEFRHLLSVFREQLLCLLWTNLGGPVAHNLWKFGIAWSLEMNQWIALDILSFSSQILEHMKDTIHCFSIY